MEEVKGIKLMLQDYVKAEKDIDYQIERLDAMRERIASVQSPAMTGMPSGSHEFNDKNAELIATAMKLEDEIRAMIEKHLEERDWLNHIINEGLKEPEEKAVIRMRYIDMMSWREVTARMFGNDDDYEAKQDSFLRKVMNKHGSAIENLDKHIASI